MINFLNKINLRIKNILKDIILNFLRKLRREEGNKLFNIIFNLKNKFSNKKVLGGELTLLRDLPKSVLLQWNEILKCNQEIEFDKNKNPEKIVFVPFNGFSEADLAVSSIFGKFFQLKGHEVSVLFCGGSLPCCGWNEFGNGTIKDNFMPLTFDIDKTRRCRSCYREINEIFPRLKIQLNNLNDYINKKHLVNAENFVDSCLEKKNLTKKIIYNGVKVSEHAYSSTLRKLLRGTLNNDDYSVAIYRRFLISSVMYVDLLEKFVKQEKPTKIICNHGIYLEHGVLIDFCKVHNIHAIVYGFPYRRNTIMASHYDTYHRDCLSEPNLRWEKVDLSDSKLKILDTYMKSKVSGGRDNVNYHPNPIIKKEILFKELGINKNEKYDCLLTNTLWDAQIFYKSNIFKNMLEWIYETIDQYKNINDRKLIIRIHPAESKAGRTTNQPVFQEIANKFPILPKNVKVIKPESDLSTYTLVENSNLTIVYGTNAALEVAYRGIPMIIAGESKSRGKNLGYDVLNKEDYFRILNLGFIEKYNSQQVMDRARKYCYHLFYRRWCDINELFNYEVMQLRQIKIEFKNLDQLKKNSFLNKFEISMLTKKPFEF